MLTRQKTILALLVRADKPLSPMAFVKMVFLLRHETELRNDRTFYDFVPYKYGPFSFALYREMAILRRDGYATPDEKCIALRERTLKLAEEKVGELPASARRAVDQIVRRYGKMSRSELMKDVYSRFPWYATRSETTGLRPKSSLRPMKARPAVYTAGYEGVSVDFFFSRLMKRGIELIVDVRANPVSRRYGFSKMRISEIAKKLGICYCHIPVLGIPSKHRTDLKSYDSYQRLLSRYEREMLPRLKNEVGEVACLMQEKPAVLICVEKDVRCCHRGRLAEAVSRRTGLEIVHLG